MIHAKASLFFMLSNLNRSIDFSELWYRDRWDHRRLKATFSINLEGGGIEGELATTRLKCSFISFCELKL